MVRFTELIGLEDQDDTEHLQQKKTEDSTSSSSINDKEIPTFISTCKDTLTLALPLAVSRLSWSAMKTTDTALIGHTGTVNLSATAVADLYTQSTGVFINGWILSTLVSHAYGSSNKKMGGIWLQVSLVVIGCLSVPVMLAWLLCGPMLLVMGVSEELIRPAAYYALVLMVAIPARIGIGQLSQYLMAQKIVNPLVKAGLFSMTINLFLGLVLVLGIGVPGWDGFGFWVSPIVTVVVEWATLFIYLYWFCFKKQLHKQGGCWPEQGLEWTNITSKRVKEYVNLYYPAALSGASDWWRVSAIGVVAVTFHDHASLAVFNSSYRIAWMSLIVIGSIGSAMGVLLGQELGKGDYNRAKNITSTCLILAFVIVLMLAAVFFTIPGKVAMVFSSDEEVIGLYQDVALPLTTMLIAMNLSVLLERVPLSCGRTQVVLWTGVVGSWAAQVPAVILCTKFYRNDLYGLFTGVTVGYCALDILLLGVVYTTDWEYYAQEAKRRSEVEAISKLSHHTADIVEQGDIFERETQSPPPSLSRPSADMNSEDRTNTNDPEEHKKIDTTPFHSTSYNSIAKSDNTFNDEEASLW